MDSLDLAKDPKRKLLFEDLISKLSLVKPKLLEQTYAHHVRLVFAGIFAVKTVWEMFLILKNLWCISDYEEVPPVEYEIPPNGWQLAVWKKECVHARMLTEYHLMMNIYDVMVTAAKFYSEYYNNIWQRTGKRLTGLLPRALWFVTMDHVITHSAFFFASLFVVLVVRIKNVGHEEVDFRSKPGAQTSYSFAIFKNMIYSLSIYDIFGLVGIAWLLFLNRFLDIFFYKKIEVESNSYFYVAKSSMKGSKEIMDMAVQMGFPKMDLLLEMRDNVPPEAVHHNFITSDVIIVSKNLLDQMTANQSKSIVGIALLHWKYGYCYWDYVGYLVCLGVKLFICAIAQDAPKFFNFHEEVHPGVLLTVVYTIVFPTVDDIFHGIAGWIHTRRTFKCDESIDDALGSLPHLKQALVQIADTPGGPPKFDKWYSSWFCAMPSLADRITRIRKRNSI